MTKALKARVLFNILSCAPMVQSRPDFKKYADAGNVDGLWSYYQNAMKSRPDIKQSVEGSGDISFEMLRPAMEAVHRLPTWD